MAYIGAVIRTIYEVMNEITFELHAGEQALRTAQAKVDELLGPLKAKNHEKETLKHEIETVSIKVRRSLMRPLS